LFPGLGLLFIFYGISLGADDPADPLQSHFFPGPYPYDAVLQLLLEDISRCEVQCFPDLSGKEREEILVYTGQHYDQEMSGFF
jgi:hypothetical protein